MVTGPGVRGVAELIESHQAEARTPLAFRNREVSIYRVAPRRRRGSPHGGAGGGGFTT